MTEKTHARRQVLEHLRELIDDRTNVETVTVHRVGNIESRRYTSVDLRIEDETTGGTAEDEYMSTFGHRARQAPLGVVITAKGPDDWAADWVDTYAGVIEQLLETDDLGFAADVDIEYRGMTTEKDEGLEDDVVQMTLAFALTYRTPVGDPYTLA